MYMARFPNLSPDATPIRMERTTIFALISLVVLEVALASDKNGDVGLGLSVHFRGVSHVTYHC
jgi:hypothetical protein